MFSEFPAFAAWAAARNHVIDDSTNDTESEKRPMDEELYVATQEFASAMGNANEYGRRRKDAENVAFNHGLHESKFLEQAAAAKARMVAIITGAPMPVPAMPATPLPEELPI